MKKEQKEEWVKRIGFFYRIFLKLFLFLIIFFIFVVTLSGMWGGSLLWI